MLLAVTIGLQPADDVERYFRDSMLQASASIGLPRRCHSVPGECSGRGRIWLGACVRRNTAERVYIFEAAHNPEVAGSNPAPAIEKALETEPFASAVQAWAENFCPTFARFCLSPGRASRTRHNTDESTFRMSKAKRTTMSKMNRERELKEKR